MSGDTLASCDYTIKEGKTSPVLLNVFKHFRRLKNEKKKKRKQHSKLFIKIQFTCLPVYVFVCWVLGKKYCLF